MRISRRVVLLMLAALAAGSAGAAEFGSAKEARAMLDRAVADLRKDKAGALARFNKGESGYKDRDLYPFCASLDGTTTAHPTMVGKNLKELKDKKGKAFGQEMFKVAQEGKVAEVTYLWPKPGQAEPVQKVSYVTRVGDQVCGVGYYK